MGGFGVKIMNKDYKAIIFDLGNVVIDVSIEPACQYWAGKLNIDPIEIKIIFPLMKYMQNLKKDS